MKILNDSGQKFYTNWCEELYRNKNVDPSNVNPPKDILHSEKYSFELQGADEIEYKEFSTKFDLAEYIYKHYKTHIQKLKLPHESWGKIMDTYSLNFFDIICPKKNGFWNPNRSEHYIYTTGGQRASLTYRHRIFGPFLIYSVSKDAANKILGSKPPFILGDIEENIGCDVDKVTNKTVLNVIAKLYITKDGKQDAITSKIPKTSWYAPGNLFRFKKVYSQFSRNYDLLSISEDALIKLMPSEFDKWLDR